MRIFDLEMDRGLMSGPSKSLLPSAKRANRSPPVSIRYVVHFVVSNAASTPERLAMIRSGRNEKHSSYSPSQTPTTKPSFRVSGEIASRVSTTCRPFGSAGQV